MKPKFMVEFIIESDRYEEFLSLVNTFSDELEILKMPGIGDSYLSKYITVSGMITSEYASILRIGNKFISDRMEFFYIEDSLKDKYRR